MIFTFHLYLFVYTYDENYDSITNPASEWKTCHENNLEKLLALQKFLLCTTEPRARQIINSYDENVEKYASYKLSDYTDALINNPTTDCLNTINNILADIEQLRRFFQKQAEFNDHMTNIKHAFALEINLMDKCTSSLEANLI